MNWIKHEASRIARYQAKPIYARKIVLNSGHIKVLTFYYIYLFFLHQERIFDYKIW